MVGLSLLVSLAAGACVLGSFLKPEKPVLLNVAVGLAVLWQLLQQLPK